MSFGKAGTMHDWTLDEAGTEGIVRHALDLGINFFDTANGYSAMYGYQFHNMQQIALAWHWAKGVASPIIGATKASHYDDAAEAMKLHLTPEDIAYLEEPYVPHPVVGAINANPPEGVMLLDEKK